MKKLLKWLFPGLMKGLYDEGYHDAIHVILGLKEKIYFEPVSVGMTHSVRNCVFMGSEVGLSIGADVAQEGMIKIEDCTVHDAKQAAVEVKG